MCRKWVKNSQKIPKTARKTFYLAVLDLYTKGNNVSIMPKNNPKNGQNCTFLMYDTILSCLKITMNYSLLN